VARSSQDATVNGARQGAVHNADFRHARILERHTNRPRRAASAQDNSRARLWFISRRASAQTGDKPVGIGVGRFEPPVACDKNRIHGADPAPFRRDLVDDTHSKFFVRHREIATRETLPRQIP
jgi:hypothetical protein